MTTSNKVTIHVAQGLKIAAVMLGSLHRAAPCRCCWWNNLTSLPEGLGEYERAKP